MSMKIKNYILFSALSSLFVSSPILANNIQTQLDAQQRAMLSMQNRMMQMEDEMKRLQGQIDELNYKISKSAIPQASSSAQSTDQNLNGQNSTTGANTAAISSDKASKESKATINKADSASDIEDDLKAVDAKAQELYDKAYALIVDNKLQDAISAFTSYLEVYKDNKLTPNAWYWKGQAQYKLKDYNSARVSFLNVVRFTSSQKRPDSLYKLGMISKLNGDAQKSMKYFELVIKTYPNDTAANFAKKELGI